MANDFSAHQCAEIEAGIAARYASFASGAEGLFRFPTGKDGLTALKYPVGALASVPDEVARLFCGVGNPFSIAPVIPGDKVLDIGCGTGVDVFVAAFFAGPDGACCGVDVSSDMLKIAARHAGERARFFEGRADNIPLCDEEFDLVISNGAFNLVVDKDLACREACRMLRSGGRLQIADQVLTVAASQNEAAPDAATWGR